MNDEKPYDPDFRILDSEIRDEMDEEAKLDPYPSYTAARAAQDADTITDAELNHLYMDGGGRFAGLRAVYNAGRRTA